MKELIDWTKCVTDLSLLVSPIETKVNSIYDKKLLITSLENYPPHILVKTIPEIDFNGENIFRTEFEEKYLVLTNNLEKICKQFELKIFKGMYSLFKCPEHPDKKVRSLDNHWPGAFVLKPNYVKNYSRKAA